ncbi:MAG TPA: hypothetical protein VMU26_10215 [Candidatus Polarisedimenticolia bacterium]|nr:hypothetical protein [Candidatus Polarisedimenticolia bacterium]
MSRLGKWLIGVVAALVVLFLVAWLWMWFAFRGTPSDIVDFHPMEFQAKADTTFFFSVGDELKYSLHSTDLTDCPAPAHKSGMCHE